MAADNSPPRIQPIVVTAFVAVLVLIGLKFVFDSYYVTMFEAEEYRKVGSVEPTELLALHAAEKKSLAGAPIPIDRAIALVAKGRAEPMDELKDGGITAVPSNDTAPLAGWAQLPRVLSPAESAQAAMTGPGASDAAAPAASGSSAPSNSPAPASSAPGTSPSASAGPAAPSTTAKPGPTGSAHP